MKNKPKSPTAPSINHAKNLAVPPASAVKPLTRWQRFTRCFFRRGGVIATWLALLATTGTQIAFYRLSSRNLDLAAESTANSGKHLALTAESTANSSKSLIMTMQSLVTSQISVLQSQHPALQLELARLETLEMIDGSEPTKDAEADVTDNLLDVWPLTGFPNVDDRANRPRQDPGASRIPDPFRSLIPGWSNPNLGSYGVDPTKGYQEPFGPSTITKDGYGEPSFGPPSITGSFDPMYPRGRWRPPTIGGPDKSENELNDVLKGFPEGVRQQILDDQEGRPKGGLEKYGIRIRNLLDQELIDVHGFLIAYRVNIRSGDILSRKMIGLLPGLPSVLNSRQALTLTAVGLSGGKHDSAIFPGPLKEHEMILHSCVVVYHRAVDHRRYVKTEPYQLKTFGFREIKYYIVPLHEVMAKDVESPSQIVDLSRRIEWLEKAIFRADDVETVEPPPSK